MIDNTIEGYSAAVTLIAQQTSARSKYLATLRQYVEGTQYEGRPGYFTDEVPLWERAPCVVYTVVEDAINQKSDLICGEERYPDVTARSVWDEDEETLEEEESSEIDKALSAIESLANLKAVSDEILQEAMGVGSVATICGVRDNRLFAELVYAEWCTPTLAPSGEVLSLEIIYGFIENVQVGRVQKAIPKLFRRVIDQSRDVTYIPVEIKAGYIVSDYEWSEDPSLTVAHGLGFAPVHWYRFMKRCNVAGRIDGYAIHRNELDEVDALNFSLSQRHRAALFSGDPQWSETGVNPGDNPSSIGRPAKVAHISSPQGGIPGPGNELHKGGYVSLGAPRPPKRRKKGPGEVWQYTNPDAKITLHTLPGDALKSLDEDGKDILRKLEQKFGIVSLDPEKMPKGNALAASAMKKLMRRMYASCDKIRINFGDNCLVPLYGMLLRIATVTGMELPGMEAVQAFIADMGEKWDWRRPPLELSWGAYSEPDPEEEKFLVDTVVVLLTNKLATKKIAVRMLKSVMGIENIDDYLEELKKESEENALAEHQALELTSQADHSRAIEMEQTKAALQPKPKPGK